MPMADKSKTLAVKKPKKKRQQAYQHRLVVITANNMLATLGQEALIHPVPDIKALSAEAIPVLRDIISRLRSSEMKKNDALNMIAHTKTDTRGGAALIPHLRTQITSCNLQGVLEVRATDEVITLLTEQQKDTIGEEEIQRLEAEWALSAAHKCKEAGLVHINLPELLRLSQQGALSTYKG